MNNNQICAQKVVCGILNKQNKLSFKNMMSNDPFSNIYQIKTFFKTSENHWIFNLMKDEEKNVICQKIVEDNDISFINNFVELRDVFEQIILLEFKSIGRCFGASKGSIMHQIDFSTKLNVNDIIKLMGKNVESIKECAIHIVIKVLLILKSLPIAFCSMKFKTKVTLLYICLYKDLVAANELQLSETVLEMILDILHFGESIALHKYITFKIFFNLVSPKKSLELYKIILNNLKLDLEAGKVFMESAAKHIKNMDKEDERYFELLNLCINYLSSPLAPKDFKKYLETLHTIVWKDVEDNFNNKSEKDIESNRQFVENSLPSLCNFFHTFFNKIEKNVELSENMRKICKIYIGNSVS